MRLHVRFLVVSVFRLLWKVIKKQFRSASEPVTKIDKSNPRVVRIPNSLHIEHIMLSESYYEEAKANPNLIIESEPEYLPFDEDGNLW